MAEDWHAGNVGDEAGKYRGWLVGQPIADARGAPVRGTEAVEVRWDSLVAGRQRASWTSREERSTLVILVAGRFRVDLTVGSATLQRQGDYVTWGPGIDHSWQAERDSVIITVRWPSRL